MNRSIRRAQRQRGEACTGYVDKRKTALVMAPAEPATPFGEVLLVEEHGEESSAGSAYHPGHAAGRQGSIVGSRRHSGDVTDVENLALQNLANEDDTFQVKAASTTPARKSVGEIFGAIKQTTITDAKFILAQEPQSNEFELRARAQPNEESRPFESVEDSKESEPSV